MSRFFNGEMFNDDRMFVMYICPCTVATETERGEVTTIFHENAPANHIWCLVTFRNTASYPAWRYDHFSTREDAQRYLESAAASVPLASRDGQPYEPLMTYEQFAAFSKAHGWIEYDYRAVFTPGGMNAREIFWRPQR